MTTFVDFKPAANNPFQFQATLDGQLYTVIVTWNLFGQRYYVNVYTLGGVLIVAIAMVGSPLDYDISLIAGYFASKLIWRVQNGQFEVSP